MVGSKQEHEARGLEETGFRERVGGRDRPGKVLPEEGQGEEFASTKNMMMLRGARHLSCSWHC